MTSTLSSFQDIIISNITLAYFEDSGWYTPDYSFGEKLIWGNGLGCNFATDRCSTWGVDLNLPTSYYCNTKADVGCTFDRKSIGQCNYNTALSPAITNPYYNYFNSTMIGGDPVADYCPFIEDALIFCNQPVPIGYNDSIWANTFGIQNSRCFSSDGTLNDSIVPVYDSGCFAAVCTAPDRLNVFVVDHYYPCPTNGGNIVPPAFTSGQLTCPPASELCGADLIDTTFPDFISIFPSCGTPTGGDKVTITGLNFVGTPSVIIGAGPCTNVVVISSQILTCTIAAQPNNLNADITITYNGKEAFRGGVFSISSSCQSYSQHNSSSIIKNLTPIEQFFNNVSNGVAGYTVGFFAIILSFVGISTIICYRVKHRKKRTNPDANPNENRNRSPAPSRRSADVDTYYDDF